MSDPKDKPMSGSPVPIGEAAPPDANEVFGNPRNFPFLWVKGKPNTPIRSPDVQFPATPTTQPPKI
jgi:hypothetical protein